MAVCGWVLYSGGSHDGQTLWSTADTNGVIVRRDRFPYEAYRIESATADPGSGGALPVAVYTGTVD